MGVRTISARLNRPLWTPAVVCTLMWVASGLFLLMGLVAGCGGGIIEQPVPELQVTSFNPLEGKDEEGRAGAIRVRFNHPAVTEEEVGRMLPEAPAAFFPPLRVAASWTDRQTLVLEPLSRLKPSTRYQVSLTGKLPGLKGRTLFSFVHRPIGVERISGVDLRRATTQPRIVLHFNQPVLASEVMGACHLVREGEDLQTTPKSDHQTSLVAPDPLLVASAVLLRPKTILQQGRAYGLRCAGLRGHGGNAPLDKPYSAKLRTFPGFLLLSSGPKSQNVPADEVKITLRFSTPVQLSRVRRALSISPPAPGIRRGTLDRTSTLYTAVVDLKTTTRYTVRLRRRLKDVYGQRMKQDHRFSFMTSDASPRLNMERGIYAVEPGSEGYAVWTRNLGHFDVQCASVPQSRVVKLLTSGMNYDPWYASGADRDLQWKRLGLRLHKKRLRLKQKKNKWELTRLQLSELCGGQGTRGLFLAELSAAEVRPQRSHRYRPRQRVLANVTNLGLLLKVGPASGLVWVTGIADGKPVAGAWVRVYTLRGNKAFSGISDRNGLVRLPGSTRLLKQPGVHDKDALEDGEGFDDYDAYRSQRLIVTAEKDGDLAVVDGNWANGIQIWNFGVPVDRRGSRVRVRGFIQSDRGIYRPGEKVHFKGLVREVELGQPPRVPRTKGGAYKRVSVVVENSRGSSIYKRRLKLSRFGGFALDLDLGADPPLGDYHVTASINGQTFRERFMVEAFRKVTYELSLKGHERHTRLGRPQRFALQADYLFGAPVKEANVKWSVQRRPHRVRFAKYPSYVFADYAAQGRYYWWWDDGGDRQLSFVSDGEGHTDSKGRYAFSIKDTVRRTSGPQDYLAQVTVTDQTDRPVSKRVKVTAHPTDFYLGLHAQEFVQAVDMPFAINTAALTPHGKPVAAQATLSLLRQRYVCKHSGSYRTYRTCERTHDKIWSREVRIPATGAGVERILPKSPGEFIIRLQGKDRAGREVAASTYVWIIGKGQAFWSGDESARLSLVASKNTYKPGEQARLVPRANMGGATALVTLERGGVLDAFIKTLKTSGEGIQIPIKGQHAPNVYASVALVRGRTGTGDAHRPRFKMGVVNLKVAPDKHWLSVNIETEQQTYEPGQRVKGTLRVTSAGRPVTAEVSLSVADEGVLQLIAYKTPDPMKSFYAPWGLGIDSATNLNRIARLNDPSALDPDEGGDSGGAATGPKVRSRFVSSAFWAPSLLTDANGEAAFSFVAPDNLTAFRLMAVAADTGCRFGSGEGRVTVSKPLLAKAVLPRFFSAGDQAEVGVMVHNYSDHDGVATVTAKIRGARLVGRPTRSLRLPHGASRRVRFVVRAGFVPRARFLFTVRMGEYGDALEKEIPVNRPLNKERTTLASDEVNGVAEVALQWPAGILPRDSRLEVSMDRTGLGELRSSLRYLVRYPYGCLEQTLSGFIPLTKVKDLAASLDLAELRGPRLRHFIKAGVAKVIRHQHSSGHFSLWPGSQTYPHLTTYAMFGLNEARKAGVRVDPAALGRGVKAMRAFANSSRRTLGPGGESATVAMAAYVLAELGQPDAGLNARLYEARRALPRYGQAFLMRGLKLANAPEEQVQILKAELLSAKQEQGPGVLIRESHKGRDTFDSLHFYMSSDVRTSAIALSALLAVQPDHPLVPRLVQGLKRAQRPDGRWYNTQDNIYALVSLADFARQRSKGKARITLRLDNKRLASRQLKGGKIVVYSRALSRIRPGTLKIQSTGPARYTVRLLLARKIAPQDSAASQGFSLQREYLDAETGQPIQQVRAGQLVKIRLKVKTGGKRNYVALEDPLPAGFEGVNTRLATSQQRPSPRPARPWRYWHPRPTWSHQELRDDRFRAFADRMAAGTHTLQYLARATTVGQFIAPPARAEAMYEPDIKGRTAASRIEVKP